MKSRMKTQMVYLKQRKPHYHDDDLEIILVLQGKITIHKVERALTMGEGEFTFINRHIVHYIESDGAYILTSKIHLADFKHIFDKIEYVEFLNNDEVVETQRPLKEFLNTVVVESLVKDYLLTNKLECQEDKMFNENYLVDVLFSCFQLISHIKKDSEHPTDELQQRYYFIVEYIINHLNEKIMVSDILKYVYMNPAYFSQFMRKVGGVGFKELISYRKLIMILTYLIKPNISMTEIASSVGMGDMKAFYSVFKRYFLVSPAKWREQVLKKNDEYVVCMDDDIIKDFINHHHVCQRGDHTVAKLYKKLLFCQENGIDMTGANVVLNPYQTFSSDEQNYLAYKYFGTLVHQIKKIHAHLVLQYPFAYLKDEKQREVMVKTLEGFIVQNGFNEAKKWKIIISVDNPLEIEMAKMVRNHLLEVLGDLNITLTLGTFGS